MNIKPWRYNYFEIYLWGPKKEFRLLVDGVDLRDILTHSGSLLLREGNVYAEQANITSSIRAYPLAPFWDYFYGLNANYTGKIELYPGSYDDCPCCVGAVVGEIQVFHDFIVWKNFTIRSDWYSGSGEMKNLIFVFERNQYDIQLERIVIQNKAFSPPETLHYLNSAVTPSYTHEKWFSFKESSFDKYPLPIEGKVWEDLFHYYHANKFQSPDSPSQNVDLMAKAVFECSVQNPHFLDYFESFGPDCFIRVDGDDPFWNVTQTGKGMNMMGYALMKARDTLNGKFILNSYLMPENEKLRGPNENPLPPWIEFPGYPPDDGFWRQPGEYWLAYIWEPFWNRLSDAEKQEYLSAHQAPPDWKWHYSKEVQKLWDAIDPIPPKTTAEKPDPVGKKSWFGFIKKYFKR